MVRNNLLETLFPGAGCRIAEMRIRDAEFDEICADLEALHAEMAELGALGTPTDPRHSVDMAETIAALRAEIAARLGRENET